MRLLEYQAKEMFSEYGIEIPKGFVSCNVADAKDHIQKLKFPVVIKAQVPVGGRGKAGAIQKCSNIDDCIVKYSQILKMTIKSEKTRSILIEQLIEHKKELYLSIFLNRGKRCYNIIASSHGGINIESVKNQTIDEIKLDHIDKNLSKNIAQKIGLGKKSISYFIELLQNMFRLIIEKEVELAEINPLVVLDNNKLLALDGKIITDDNASFRHNELQKFREKTTLEEKAEKNGFTLIELDGNIAVIGNGAGLVMSTLDILSDSGGKAACFLDVGGSATINSVYEALKLISEIKKVDGILINLYGGIVKTTTVALAFVRAHGNRLIKVPVSTRLRGAEAEKSKEIFADTKTPVFDSVEEAINFILSKTR